MHKNELPNHKILPVHQILTILPCECWYSKPDINASSSSVATLLRCDVIFNYCFSENLLLSTPVKVFLESVTFADH